MIGIKAYFSTLVVKIVCLDGKIYGKGLFILAEEVFCGVLMIIAYLIKCHAFGTLNIIFEACFIIKFIGSRNCAVHIRESGTVLFGYLDGGKGEILISYISEEITLEIAVF